MTVAATAAFWDALADRYAAKPVDDAAAFERKIAVTRAHLGPQHVALDIGCGTGSLLLRLADTGARLHGLDLSAVMIGHALRKANEQQATNVTFHVGAFDDGFDVFAPGSLDAVFAYSLLHLVEDRPAALRRMFDLLRPGGTFIASTVCLGGTWIPYAPLLAAMRLIGKAPPVVRVFGADALDAEIAAAGFVDVQRPDVGAKPTIAFRVARKPA